MYTNSDFSIKCSTGRTVMVMYFLFIIIIIITEL